MLPHGGQETNTPELGYDDSLSLALYIYKLMINDVVCYSNAEH